MATGLATSSSLRDSQSRKEARRDIDVELWTRDDRIAVERRQFDIKYETGDIQDLNGRFINILEELRVEFLTQHLGRPKDAGIKELSDDVFKTTMQKLRALGQEAYVLLPEQAVERIATLDKDEGDRGISLTFTFPAPMALLWEMVYVLGDEAAGDSDDPMSYFESFWGFHYPIGHLYWDWDVGDRVRLQEGVFASAHEELEHTHEELTKLDQTLRNFAGRLIGSDVQIVLARLEKEEALDLAELDGDTLFRHFAHPDFGYGVVHFACHCINPEDAGASEAYLSLMAQKNEVQVSLGRLNVLAKTTGGFHNKPLVFLNACESQTPLHFLQTLNLPDSLLKFKAGGVIATACTVPDRFASAFATEFYKRLLCCSEQKDPRYHDWSNSIGEALLETRRFFLKEYKNPLGLAYGLYAMSNQELRL